MLRVCARLMWEKTVALTTVEAAISGLADLTPKDEFETTAQFTARRAAALRGVTTPLIIGKEPEESKYLKYDADAGVLRIITYAFHNRYIDYWSAFYNAGMHNKIDVSTDYYGNIAVVITISDKVSGKYVGTNAYGAKIEVTKIQRYTSAIFDREKSLYNKELFPNAANKPYVVGEFGLSPAEAKRLKPQLKLAFVVTPKEPYFVTGSHKDGKTTVNNPRDITENFSVLVADFQCGLVMDVANKVLGAYPMR